jgi:thiamine pyrophosphate-dependent acetolactate synthase large subunit-like protein
MMMTLDVCKVLADVREDAVVVCTMGAMNAFDKLPANPLTVACVPLMGGAASIGLGLALARTERKVFVVDGDASLLMELGGLVAVAQAAPANFFHFLVNNGIQFAGLGNLATPGHASVDFPALARAAGYRACYQFKTIEEFQAAIATILAGAAPAFIELVVGYDQPALGVANPAVEMTDARFTRMGDEIREIRAQLGVVEVFP